MGDGGFIYFLLLLFVFWVLETIAKARRRAQHPEELEMEEEWRHGDVPSGPVDVETRRTPEEQQPRDLLEELADLARRRQEEIERTRRPEPRPRPEGPTPRAQPQPESRPRPEGPTPRAQPQPQSRPRPEGPTPRRQPQPSAARPPPGPMQVSVPADRPASTRWERGREREVVARPGRPVGEERRSDRWMAGKEREVPERAGRPVPEAAEVAERPRRERALRREPLAVRRAARPAGEVPDPMDLRRVSREELRRIVVLREVLGPPLALREDGDGRPQG